MSLNTTSLAFASAVLLAVVGCAAPGHAGHDSAADSASASKAGGSMAMMDEMCKKHAAAPGGAASMPEMMAKHCAAKADGAAAAGSAPAAHH
jgi:uncharacterized protein involved in copper resistance